MMMKSDPGDTNSSSMDDLETVEDSTAGITPVSNIDKTLYGKILSLESKISFFNEFQPQQTQSQAPAGFGSCAYSYNVQKVRHK